MCPDTGVTPVPGPDRLLFSGTQDLPLAGPCPPGTGSATLALKGLRCISGAQLRHGVRGFDAGGATVAPWGFPGAPLLSQFGAAAGQVRYFQMFYRDLPTLSCMRDINTTNGVAITVVP